LNFDRFLFHLPCVALCSEPKNSIQWEDLESLKQLGASTVSSSTIPGIFPSSVPFWKFSQVLFLSVHWILLAKFFVCSISVVDEITTVSERIEGVDSMVERIRALKIVSSRPYFFTSVIECKLFCRILALKTKNLRAFS
jgi:hypothetical protein